MSTLNVDIVWLIAEFLEPNPERYSRLSKVDKTFRQVFTSDKLWKRFNPYGLESGIFDHYMESSTKDRLLAEIYWPLERLDIKKAEYALGLTDNKYVLAGIYRIAGSNRYYGINLPFDRMGRSVPNKVVDIPSPLNASRPFMFAAASPSSYFSASLALRVDCDFLIACDLPDLHSGGAQSYANEHFEGASKEGILKVIRSFRHNPAKLMPYLLLMPTQLFMDLDIVNVDEEIAAHMALKLPNEVFERSEKLLVDAVTLHAEAMEFKVSNLITKEVLGQLKNYRWTNLPKYLSAEMLADTHFVKGLVSNSSATLKFPTTAEYSPKWINEVCQVCNNDKYEGIRQLGMVTGENTLSASTIKELKEQRCDYYLALEYLRARNAKKNTDQFLVHSTEAEYIKRAMETEYLISPGSVSAEALLDRELALELVKHNYRFYSCLTEKFKNDPEFFEALFVQTSDESSNAFKPSQFEMPRLSDLFSLTDLFKTLQGASLEPQAVDMESLPDRWASDRASLQRIFRSDRKLKTPFKPATIQLIASDSELLGDLLNHAVEEEAKDTPLGFGQEKPNSRYIFETFAPHCTVENAVNLAKVAPELLIRDDMVATLKKLSRPVILKLASNNYLKDGLFQEDEEILINSIKFNPERIVALETEPVDHELYLKLARQNPSILAYTRPEIQSKVLDALCN